MEAEKTTSMKSRMIKYILGCILMPFFYLLLFLILGYLNPKGEIDTTPLLPFVTIGFVLVGFFIYRDNILIFKSTNAQLSLYFVFLLSIINLFTCNFYSLYYLDPSSFAVAHSSGNSFVDFLYYSVVTLGTIGYGDITPVSIIAKVLTMLEVLTGMVSLVLVLSSFRDIFSKGNEGNGN